MDPNQSMVDKVFGGGMWNFTNIYEGLDVSVISNLALVVGFLLFGLQIGIEAFKEGGITSKKMIVNISWLLILVALIKTPNVYENITKYAIGKPAEICATSICGEYAQDYAVSAAGMLDSYGKSKSSVVHFLAQTIKGSITTQILAGIVFTIATAMIFLTNILQARLFEFMIIIGPMCLIFSICEWTSSVARNWLNLTLAIAWMSFFASCALLVFTKSGIMEILAESANWSDIIPVIVYGAISIILILSAFPITAYLFNSQGSGVGKMVAAGAAISGTATIAARGSNIAGKAGIAAGNIMQKSGNSTIKNMGGSLTNISRSIESASTKDIAQSMSKSSGGGGQMSSPKSSGVPKKGKDNE